jgi:tetratricopeptide (TPR) repeat protein
MKKINRPGRNIIILITLCMATQIAFAQNQPSPQMVAANKLFAEQNWSEAAKAYEQVTKNEPNNPRAWLQLGKALISLKKYELAIAALEKNVAIANNPFAMLKMAGAYARLNQKDKALEWLDKAAKNGVATAANLDTETDLDTLRGESRFKEIALVIEKERKPCLFMAETKQFDFWLGEWEVFNLQGQKAGVSKIETVSGGCAILENWTNAQDLSGKSINFYDSYSKKWNQYWIGSDGIPIRFEGVFLDNAMRYEGVTVEANGKKTLNRLTFFNLDANTVRQLGEDSTDDGKTWTVSYDLKYVRKTGNTKGVK